MKIVTLLLIAMLSLCLAGCNNKDPELTAYITELDVATKEIVAKIDADPRIAGIDAAQKALDDRRESLKTKWDSVRGAVDFGVNVDARKKLEDSVANNMKALGEVGSMHMAKLEKDEAAMAKFKTLIADYQEPFSTNK